MGRSIFVVFLILAILVSITPQAQTNITAAWESVRPAVIDSMDNLYALVRGFVAGNGSQHQIHENPKPLEGIDAIVTMRSAAPF